MQQIKQFLIQEEAGSLQYTARITCAVLPRLLMSGSYYYTLPMSHPSQKCSSSSFFSVIGEWGGGKKAAKDL